MRRRRRSSFILNFKFQAARHEIKRLQGRSLLLNAVSSLCREFHSYLNYESLELEILQLTRKRGGGIMVIIARFIKIVLFLFRATLKAVSRESLIRTCDKLLDGGASAAH